MLNVIFNQAHRMMKLSEQILIFLKEFFFFRVLSIHSLERKREETEDNLREQIFEHDLALDQTHKLLRTIINVSEY
jgi:hypothetical protein